MSRSIKLAAGVHRIVNTGASYEYIYGLKKKQQKKHHLIDGYLSKYPFLFLSHEKVTNHFTPFFVVIFLYVINHNKHKRHTWHVQI